MCANPKNLQVEIATQDFWRQMFCLNLTGFGLETQAEALNDGDNRDLLVIFFGF